MDWLLSIELAVTLPIFDPWGKQEFVWTVDIKRAWVFSSEQDANAAIRWMPRENQLSIKRLLP
jgi:hypothetical protein